MKIILISFLILFTSATLAVAEDVYQAPESFIAESFLGNIPAPRSLAPDSQLQEKIEKIMGSHYALPKIQYWFKDGRTAWVLEDIGKFEPITTGIVVGPDGTLERVKVLIYRESHGWEVKHEFFTRQFKGAGLKKEKKLDQRIDGISGATLSVNALKRLSALALLLHENVNSDP